MDYQKNSSSCCNIAYDGWETMSKANNEKEMLMNGLRKGPWTEEEDSKLTSSVVIHGVGRWNNLANLAGLKRSGKSCRLRWLNYLRPDLRRGDLALDEQLLILELHLRWGNRWSKIAENLPGRTDNEIKNFWRTKVQKLARQFQCNVNSQEFNDALRNVWIPILVEQIQANARPTSNNVGAQSEGPSSECKVGPKSTYCSSISEDRSLVYTTATSAQMVGPVDLFSKPNNETDSSEALFSPEAGSYAELDPYWEQNLNDFIWDMRLYDGNQKPCDANDLLFLQQQLESEE